MLPTKCISRNRKLKQLAENLRMSEIGGCGWGGDEGVQRLEKFFLLAYHLHLHFVRILHWRENVKPKLISKALKTN